MKGKIYLIPSPLGESAIDSILPSNNKTIIDKIDCFIVEDVRTARRFLKKIGYIKNFDDTIFHVLNKHTQVEELSAFLKSAEEGKDIGIISECGCPAVADPGAVIVALAHKKNIRVVPLVGPSSILLSLMASGFNGQNFAFLGYLPKEKSDRTRKLKELEQLIFKQKQTQIFIETPYRNQNLFEDIISVCHNEIKLCIAIDITLDSESIITKSISDWKKHKPELNKRQVIFLLN